MAMIDVFNEIREMDDVDEIKMIIKRELLSELAGDDFSIKEKKSSPKKEITPEQKMRKKISEEVFKRKTKWEKENGKKITKEEKDLIRMEVEEEYNK